MAAPLSRLVDVKIKNTQWFNFFDLAALPTNKQISFANLENTNYVVPLSTYVKSVV